MGGTDYRERPAPPGLGLACVWSHSAPRGEVPYIGRVVPDACIDIIWSDWDGELHVAGPDTGPFLATIAPGGRLAGVRFRPGLAAAVLGVPADALTDGRVALRELWGAAAGALAQAVADAATARGGDPTGPLVRAVAARGRAAEPADPVAPALVSELASAPPGADPAVRHAAVRQAAVRQAAVRQAAVRQAAARLGLSERQLRRRSLAAFGYGPKTLARILRFQRALRLARGGMPPADVACATGYADQAHLAHEVRDLAGVPITALLEPAATVPGAPPR